MKPRLVRNKIFDEWVCIGTIGHHTFMGHGNTLLDAYNDYIKLMNSRLNG